MFLCHWSNRQGTLGHSRLSSLSHCGQILAQRVELVCASWSPRKKTHTKRQHRQGMNCQTFSPNPCTPGNSHHIHIQEHMFWSGFVINETVQHLFHTTHFNSNKFIQTKVNIMLTHLQLLAIVSGDLRSQWNFVQMIYFSFEHVINGALSVPSMPMWLITKTLFVILWHTQTIHTSHMHSHTNTHTQSNTNRHYLKV